MSYFSKPNRIVVEHANLLICPTENNSQLTVFQNSVFSNHPDHAPFIILPVPCPATLRFHGISTAGNLFSTLQTSFVPGDGQPTALKVKQSIGNYDVSLIQSLDELVEASGAELSEQTRIQLRSYPCSWGFVVLRLSDQPARINYRPIAFSHERPKPSQLYIPALQGDQDLFVYGVDEEFLDASELPLWAAGSPEEAVFNRNVFACKHADCLVRLWPDEEAGLALPASSSFKKYHVAAGICRRPNMFISISKVVPAGRIGSSECVLC